MDTRRFAEPARTWTAGASVFSGRRDPHWPLPEDTAAMLEARWSALEPLEGETSAPPALGYRGCWAQAPDGAPRFAAYRGEVTRAELSAAAPDIGKDPARSFERIVLESAPDPVLRDQLLALAGLSEADPAPPA